MANAVISTVEAMAEKEGQPLIKGGVPVFEWRPNASFEDFLEEQGYELTENIFYQDNQSAIRFEKNGRASCGQKSRHIDIRYFFMQDRFESEGISVVYCPTDEMLANFFTKPLQGSLFRKFRAVLLGHCHVNALTKSPLPPSVDRVENPILEKVRSGASGQTLALSTKKKVSEQMEVASVPTYGLFSKRASSGHQ
jgi:hypothetical protein